jgi:hypothetical protein
VASKSEDIRKLLETVQSARTSTGLTAPTAGVSSIAPIPGEARYQTTAVPTGVGDAAIGAVNIFGGFMRGLTSLGRGIVNYAGNVLPYANQIYDNLEDGIQPDDLPKVFGAAANATWSGLGGFAKGFAYSFMPPTQESRNQLNSIFGGDTYEGAYELFKSEDFQDASKNLPFLAEATKEEGVGWGIPDEWIGFDVPFLGIEKGKGLEFTKAGLYSFGFDVLTDPISFLPIGIGGAAKGLKTGVETAARAARAKPDALPGAFAPRILYPELDPARQTARELGEDVGKFKLKTASPDAAVAYNALDTSPLTFIGKEMARGYKSSFQAIRARSVNRRVARVNRNSSQAILNSSLIKLTEAGVDPGAVTAKMLYDEAESILKESRRSLAQRAKDRKVAKQTQAEIEQLLEAKFAGIRETELTPEAIAKMQAEAKRYAEELAGVPQAEKPTRLRALMARDTARTIRNQVPVVSRQPGRTIRTKAVNDLGDRLVEAQDVEGSVASFWDGFRATDEKAISKTTKTAALREMFSPLPTGKDGGLTTQQVRELSGLVKGELTRRAPKATKGKGVKGEEAARPTELADVIDEARGRLEEAVGMPLAKMTAADVSGEQLEEALQGQFRVAGERLRILAVRETQRVNRDYANLEIAGREGYNPITIEPEPALFSNYPTTQAGSGGRTDIVRRLTNAGEDAYPTEIVAILKEAGVKDIHSLTYRELQAKATEALETLTFMSARLSSKAVTAKAFNARLGQLNLADYIQIPTNKVAADLKRIEDTAAQLYPGFGQMSKKRIDQLAKELDGALTAHVSAYRDLPAEVKNSGLEAVGSSAGKIRGIRDALTSTGPEGLEVDNTAEFIAEAYRVSRLKGSIDGGRFADYVDEVILQGAEMPKIPGEIETLLLDRASTWDGEGLTVGLLTDVARNISKGGEKALGTKNRGFNTLSAALIEQERDRALTVIQDRIDFKLADDIIDDTAAVLVKDDAEWKAVVAGLYKLELPLLRRMGVVPKVSPNLKGNELTLANQNARKRVEALLKAPASERRFKYAWAQELKNAGVPLGGALKKYTEGVSRQAQVLGKKGATRQRAEEFLDAIWPARLTKEGAAEVATRTSPEKARSAMFAEAIMARFTVGRDIESRLLKEAQLQTTRFKTADGLQKEKQAFEATLKKLDASLAKKGFKRPKKGVENLEVADVIVSENPRDLLRKIATMRVVTDEEVGDWRLLVNEVLERKIDGGKTPFKRGSALIEAFKKDPSSVTAEQVRDVLADYKYKPAVKAVLAGTIPNDRNLRNWVTKTEELITQAEKELLEQDNAIARAGFHPTDADETIQALAQLTREDRLEFLNNFKAQYEDLISIAHAGGYGWLVDEALVSLGPGFRNFFVERQNAVKVYHDDLYGTTTKVIEQGDKKIGLKESYEILSQYTGFGQLITRIKDYVEKSNIANKDAAIQDLTLHAMRIQETYMLLRGVVPSATPMKRVGGQEVYAALGNKQIAEQLAEMNYIPAFIFQGDILEMLPRALAKDIWFSGRGESLPPSAIGEAARVLVSHMSNLKPGEWFTPEQFQTVYYHMTANTIAQARNTKPFQGKDVNWLELNGEAGIEKIDRYIRYLLSDDTAGGLEAPSFRLYEKHRENMAYASMVLRQTAPNGKIIGDLREKMERLMANGLVTKEAKFAAIREAADDLNQYLQIDELGTDFADFLAAHDAMVNISTQLTRDDLIDLSQSAALTSKKQQIADLKKRKAKPADIKAARKTFSDEKKRQYMETQNARADLLLDIYMQKANGMANAQREFGQSAAYDVFNDTATEAGNVAWWLRFSDNVGKKLSFNWGMETLRSAVGGAQRFALRMENMFTKGSARVAVKWQKQQQIDGVEYLTSSFEALKLVPDESIRPLLDDLDILAKGMGPGAKQNGISEKLGGEVSEALERIRNITDESGARIFENFDDLKMNALMDVARPLFRVFDELAEVMPEPQLMNFYLKQAGELTPAERQAEIPIGDTADEIAAIRDRREQAVEPIEARGVAFPPNLQPENYAQAWRDMDWDKNLQSLNSIHFALRKSEEWYMIAGEATRLSGARKLTDFASPQAAADAGYVRLKGIDELKLGNELTGRELLYFMDTKNYVYPAWMVGEVKNLADFLGAPYRQGIGALTQGKFFRRINTVQNFAKQMMTNLRPGNHLMNFMGGVLINDVAGLRNPANYLYSLRLLKAAGISQEALGVSRDAAEYWMERHFVDIKRTSNLQIKEVSDPALRKDAVGMTLGGSLRYVSYEDLASMVMKEGGFVPWQQSANLDLLNAAAAGPNLQAFKKQGLTKKAWNETSEVVGSWASHRDDFVRMALLIDTLKKGNWANLEDGVKSALDTVNRYHPQPQEVSKFNRDVTRHLILFFTWRAKTLGTIVGDLLERPGRLLTWERAYYNYQAGQGYQPEYFGSHDPKDEPVRSWQQNTLGILTGGNEYSMSIAHPMWDLMGSDGWLSQIKWDSNQSAGANVAGAFLGTSQQVLYASAPLIENLFVNWLNGRTANGQDLMRGGITDEEMPTFLQEVANGFGLNVAHATLAYFYPEQVTKANWDRLTEDERTQELLRSWFNWATGARAQKYLTPDNVKKAGAELKTSLRQLAQRGGPTLQPGGEDAIAQLLDYLQKAGEGSLND